MSDRRVHTYIDILPRPYRSNGRLISTRAVDNYSVENVNSYDICINVSIFPLIKKKEETYIQK